MCKIHKYKYDSFLFVFFINIQEYCLKKNIEWSASLYTYQCVNVVNEVDEYV